MQVTTRKEDDLSIETEDDIEAPEVIERPFVQLVGEDGNAWFIIARCRSAAKAAHWPKERIEAFTNEAMSGNYDHVLQTVMANFETA